MRSCCAFNSRRLNGHNQPALQAENMSGSIVPLQQLHYYRVVRQKVPMQSWSSRSDVRLVQKKINVLHWMSTATWRNFLIRWSSAVLLDSASHDEPTWAFQQRKYSTRVIWMWDGEQRMHYRVGRGQRLNQVVFCYEHVFQHRDADVGSSSHRLLSAPV